MEVVEPLPKWWKEGAVRGDEGGTMVVGLCSSC